MDSLISALQEEFVDQKICPFSELQLCRPEKDKGHFLKKYAGTMVISGGLYSRRERYEVYSFIQKHTKQQVFTMGFATGFERDSPKCQCCKQYCDCEEDGRFEDIYVCYACRGYCPLKREFCVRGDRFYRPIIKDVVLFAFHDFRPRKEVVRQRKQIKRRLPDILLAIHAEDDSRLSWLPKDIVKLIATL